MRRARKSDNARESGVAGSFSPTSAAISTMRDQYFGVRTIRRRDGPPLASRNSAIATLAEIMKFAIKSRALFESTTARSTTLPWSSITGLAWIVSKSSAPCSFLNSPKRSAISDCNFICASIPGTLLTLSGTPAFPSSQAPTDS